jgi:hypothetical protein
MLQKVQIGKLNQPHLFNVRWESVTLGLKSMQLLRRERRARATTNKKTLTAFSQDGKPVSQCKSCGLPCFPVMWLCAHNGDETVM